MGAPDAVLELVERFRHNFSTYLNPANNETQVRIEFIDPFFKALGWDVDNSAGNAPQYRDVVHEDAIKVGIESRAPDYSFRVGGARKFFVEAKKPAINLKDDPSPAYQLRRYAWSAKLPLSNSPGFRACLRGSRLAASILGGNNGGVQQLWIVHERDRDVLCDVRSGRSRPAGAKCRSTPCPDCQRLAAG